MKILVVSPVFPQRRSGGFALRTDGILRELAVEHDVHLLCLRAPESEPEPDPAERRGIEGVVKRLDLVERPGHEDSHLRARVAMLRQRVPPGAQVFDRPALQQAFRGALEHRPDLVLFESIYPAALLPLVPPGCPVVVDEHNVEYLLMRRAGRPAGVRPWKHLKWEAHWRLVRSFEARILRSSDMVFATSAVDRRYLARLSPDIPIEVVPNGVGVPARPPRATGEIPGRILYTGLMAYPPNVDAAVWFAKSSFPSIAERFPEAHLVIAGARPTAAVQELAQHPGISVTGEVDDMTREIDQASVIVVPLRQGSGTRLKILEAWSRGKPVVSTTLGCEGLSVRPATDIVLANRPADFVEQIGALLRAPGLRQRLGEAGFETVCDRYSWGNIGRILREALGRLKP